MSDGEQSYLRGAFIAFEPKAYPNGSRISIPFRFNPEILSRSLQVEQGKSGSGTEGGKKSGGGAGDSGADASLGSLKQTLTVQVRFDFDDRADSASIQALPPELGILPEISALENLLYPAESPTDANSDGKEPVKARRARPTVLFVWGKNRVLPVRITGMTVNETRFNAELNPTRAEVDVNLEVLGDGDAKDNAAVKDALAYTASKRQQAARQFLATASSQGTKIPKL